MCWDVHAKINVCDNKDRTVTSVREVSSSRNQEVPLHKGLRLLQMQQNYKEGRANKMFEWRSQ